MAFVTRNALRTGPALALVAALSGSCPASPAVTQTPAAHAAAPDRPSSEAFAAKLRSEIDAALALLSDQPDAAVVRAEQLWALTIAHARLPQDADLFRDAAALHLLATHLQIAEPPVRTAVLPILLQNPRLRETLVFAVRPEEDPKGIYAVLARLAREHPQHLADKARLAGLVAAICVVYDTPPPHPVLGAAPEVSPGSRPARRGFKPSRPAAPPPADPAEIFEYFAANQGRMSFDAQTPVQLQVHIVDLHADAADREWALRNHAGNRAVGKLYATIVYDTGHFKYGREKKVFQNGEGYTLRNIQKCGGVCAEQAYFTSNVAKSVGIPAAYVLVEGSDVSHAYVGYLKGQGRSSQWDFSEGRYDEYEEIGGSVRDPQTGRRVPDSYISLTAGLLGSTEEDRHLAAAITHAAAWLRQRRETRFPPPVPEGWPRPRTEPRMAEPRTRLDLLQSALKIVPAYAPGWHALAQAGAAEEVTAEERNELTQAIMRLAGRSYPDFALAIVAPMIGAVPDPAGQSRLWDWAHDQFRSRPDLAADVRFMQGEMWEKAQNPAKAWSAYKEVITRYPDDGRLIVKALARAEGLLTSFNKADQILPLYADAFRRISKPATMSEGFARSSNHARVGSRYAQLLAEAGRAADAERIRRQIGLETLPTQRTPRKR